ncbi:hypothetical protein D3C87_1896050 [compost metagenome]
MTILPMVSEAGINGDLPVVRTGFSSVATVVAVEDAACWLVCLLVLQYTNKDETARIKRG